MTFRLICRCPFPLRLPHASYLPDFHTILPTQAVPPPDSANDVLAYPVYVTAVGTEQILHLPHIYKVFGYILFFQLLRNLHDKMYEL